MQIKGKKMLDKEWKVLLLCGTHNDLGLIKALRKLGAYIIMTGNICNLPGQKYVDKYIQADYSDKELILNIAKEYKIDAICQCCNDFGVYTASYIAEKLNLPGYDSYETTLTLHNKNRFKIFAEENGILSPISRIFEKKEDALEYVKNIQYPAIIKPADASAGNGITCVKNIKEAENAIEYAYSKSRISIILIEEFIKGTQHGFCTFLKDKKVVACCSNNEYSIINPYRVEIDTYPADNFTQVEKILVGEIEKIAGLLELKDGIFHLQYIMKDGKPYIIEVMRRVLGNMYSVPANMLNNIDWDYWEVRAKCGLSCEDFPQNIKQEGFYAYKAVLAKENGIIKSIKVPKEYEKYLLSSFYILKEGDKIENYKSQPLGFLFFMFPSDKVMKDILIDNYNNTLVEME